MATPDREVLPQDVKPVHYDLSIFDLELGGEFSYKGCVKIDYKLHKPTQTIVLNAFQLKLLQAKITDSNGKEQKSTEFSYDAKAQRASIQFPDGAIEADGTVEIDFSGTINSDMAGFYRSRYKPTVDPVASVPKVGDFHFMFSTQFESCDARRAFPCFDEPNLKATFDFAIEVPEDQTALSNMPIKETRKASKDGLKVVSFEKTPIMSTYLLAWAVGDFTYVEAETKRVYNHGKRIPVRVYTTRGLEQQGQFALENAHKTLDYFSEIFDLEYPLPKSDLLAVHEFSHGAMENWGLVTYRTTAVLFDEKTSDPKFKKRIAYVVAHELAHQWFGNLVTMDWWSELWLNEGFATWVGWLATDHFYPEWKVWAQFIAEGVQRSLDLDSLRSSHPIEVPVKNALEIDQVFDAISYLKGSSMIRMLGAHLTVPVFLKGVSDYLKAHAYGNARTTDLWAAISKASGKDVISFMNDWIQKIGYPVVTIAEEPGQITVRQSRFLSTGDVKPDEDDVLWWIPLALKTGADTSKVSSTALYAKEDTIRNVDETFYKLNSDSIGFYRTNYPPDRLTKLGAAREKLSIEDRIGLVGDADALALSGAATAAGLLNLCAEFEGETEYLVWAQIASSLNSLRSTFSQNNEIRDGLKRFILKLITPTLKKVGWTAKPGEGLLEGELRALVISLAGSAGDDDTVKEAMKKFEEYQKGNTDAFDPNLREAVFKTAVLNGGKEPYEHLKTAVAEERSADARDAALLALGRIQSAELVKDLLEFNLSDTVAIQDAHNVVMSLAVNSAVRNEMWTWIKANWDRLRERLGGNPVVLSRFVRLALNHFADHAVERDVSEFFATRDTEGFDKVLAQVVDAIKRNANYRKRDEALVLEWLKSKGFA